MKLARSRSLSLLASAFALAGISSALAEHATKAPVVIQIPPVQDGSMTARAPFPSQRVQNDVKRADGQAVDADLPPNTPNTSPPAPPAPVVQVMQKPGSPDRSEPALTPTGPATLTVAATIDSARVTPGIKALSFESRETALADLETKRAAANKTADGYRDTLRDMAAADRDRFKDAAAELEKADNALNHSLKQAKKADAGEWEAARAQVAADYEAYATAAANLDTVAAALHPSL